MAKAATIAASAVHSFPPVAVASAGALGPPWSSSDLCKAISDTGRSEYSSGFFPPFPFAAAWARLGALSASDAAVAPPAAATAGALFVFVVFFGFVIKHYLGYNWCYTSRISITDIPPAHSASYLKV